MPITMVRSRVPVALGILSAATLLLTAASVWARQVDALLGTGTLFAALAPWITGALGVTAAALWVARCRRSRESTDSPGQGSASSEVREGEARLNAIMQSAMDAIIAVDSDQRIVFFNPAAQKMLGCSAAEAIGAPLDRFIPERSSIGIGMYPRDGATVDALLSHADGAMYAATARGRRQPVLRP